MRLGALEAGGTKMVCGVGDAQGHVFTREVFPTTTPQETMGQIVAFFRRNAVDALGIGSFGPLDLAADSPTFGNITTTPKLAWQQYPIYRELQQQLGVPCAIDTDVNAACYGEYRLGAGKGLHSAMYITIGTGIGAGLICEDRLVHGLVHPEFGHILLRPHAQDPLPHGVCPFHDGCLEGLASGPSIEKRFGVPAAQLPPTHLAWELEAEYLSQMCMNAICTVSPQIIVLGGGVMHQKMLFDRIRTRTLELLQGYVQHERLLHNIEHYIVPPMLGDNAGAVGALLLAQDAFLER